MLVNTDNYLCKEDVFNSLKLRTESVCDLQVAKHCFQVLVGKSFTT